MLGCSLTKKEIGIQASDRAGRWIGNECESILLPTSKLLSELSVLCGIV